MAADYATLEKIGEGTFGQVFRAKHRRTGEVFALKKIRLRRAEDGLATAALRELKALQQLEHRNVVRLVESFPHGSALVLVLEHMQSDLARLLEHAPTRLCEADVKCLALMLLHGVAACHAHNIVHRVRARAPAARPGPPRARAGRDPRRPQMSAFLMRARRVRAPCPQASGARAASIAWRVSHSDERSPAARRMAAALLHWVFARLRCAHAWLCARTRACTPPGKHSRFSLRPTHPSLQSPPALRRGLAADAARCPSRTCAARGGTALRASHARAAPRTSSRPTCCSPRAAF